jgi:hypothetical protein
MIAAGCFTGVECGLCSEFLPSLRDVPLELTIEQAKQTVDLGTPD